MQQIVRENKFQRAYSLIYSGFILFSIIICDHYQCSLQESINNMEKEAAAQAIQEVTIVFSDPQHKLKAMVIFHPFLSLLVTNTFGRQYEGEDDEMPQSHAPIPQMQNYLDPRSGAYSALTGGIQSAYKGSNLSYGNAPMTTKASTVAPSAVQTLSQRKTYQRTPDSHRKIGSGDHRVRTRSRSTKYDPCEPDSKDNAFIYPCRAFKQFFITLKEGKINLNDIEISRPDIIQFLGGRDSISPQPRQSQAKKGDRISGSRSQRPTTSRSPGLHGLSLTSHGNNPNREGLSSRDPQNKRNLLTTPNNPSAASKKPLSSNTNRPPSTTITPYQPSANKSIRDQIEESNNEDLSLQKPTQKHKQAPIKFQPPPQNRLSAPKVHKKNNKSVLLTSPPAFAEPNSLPKAAQKTPLKPKNIPRKPDIKSPELKYQTPQHISTFTYGPTVNSQPKRPSKKAPSFTTPTPTQILTRGIRSSPKKSIALPAYLTTQPTPITIAPTQQLQTPNTAKLGGFDQLPPTTTADGKSDPRFRQYLTSPSAFNPYTEQVTPVNNQLQPQQQQRQNQQKTNPRAQPNKYIGKKRPTYVPQSLENEPEESSSSEISVGKSLAYQVVSQPESYHTKPHQINQVPSSSGFGVIEPITQIFPVAIRQLPISKQRPLANLPAFPQKKRNSNQQSGIPRLRWNSSNSSSEYEETKQAPLRPQDFLARESSGSNLNPTRFSTKPSHHNGAANPEFNRITHLNHQRRSREERQGSGSMGRVIGAWNENMPFSKPQQQVTQPGNNFPQRLSMKRQSSLGDNVKLSSGNCTQRGLIEDKGVPDHRSSGTASVKNLARPSMQINNYPSLPNLSNLKSQDDPSQGYEEESQKNPRGATNQIRLKKKQPLLNRSKSPSQVIISTIQHEQRWNTSTNPVSFNPGINITKKYDKTPKSNRSRTNSQKRRNNKSRIEEEDDILTPTSNSYYTSSKPSAPRNAEFTYHAQPFTMNNAMGKVPEDYKLQALTEERSPEKQFLRSKTPKTGEQQAVYKKPSLVQPALPQVTRFQQSGSLRNPLGSPSSLHISSLMSPGTKGGDPTRPNHFDDTFPSAISGTIGYGHVGGTYGTVQPSVLPQVRNIGDPATMPTRQNNKSRVSREQRKMRHSSTGEPDYKICLQYAFQFESKEKLRQPELNVADMLEKRGGPVHEARAKLKPLVDPIRTLYGERRPTGRFGPGDFENLQNLPLQMRPSQNQHIGNHRGSAPNQNYHRLGSPNEESKRRSRQARLLEQNSGSPKEKAKVLSPQQNKAAPLTPEQDQTLKNLIKQLSPTRKQPSDQIMPIIDSKHVKGVMANKGRQAANKDLAAPRQTFGITNNSNSKPLMEADHIEDFDPMIESPKYNIDEPLTIGIISQGSHLKDSFGARPDPLRTSPPATSSSPTDFRNRGMREQRGGLYDQMRPLIVNQVHIPTHHPNSLSQKGGRLLTKGDIQSPEDLSDLKKPLSQRFSSLCFEEKKSGQSPIKYSQTMRKSSDANPTPQQHGVLVSFTVGADSPLHKSNLASSDRIPNSAYETPQNTSIGLRKLSKFRELELRLRQSVTTQGATFKSIDYRLINQLQHEAARVVQRFWRATLKNAKRQPVKNNRCSGNTLSGRTFTQVQHQATSPMMRSPIIQQVTMQSRGRTRDECLNTELSSGKCCCTCHNTPNSAIMCPICRQPGSTQGNNQEELRKFAAAAIMWSSYLYLQSQTATSSQSSQVQTSHTQCCLHQAASNSCRQCHPAQQRR